jgi:hypothetical protein
MRLRRLQLRSITASAVFGADIPFDPGLNVIYAGNTSGKSTCLQAIIYVLGLERSLGPHLEIPLPYAMRERIHRHRDEPYEPVIQSYVQLELENLRGEVITVRRDIVGGKDTKLIQMWDAGVLSKPNTSAAQRDFYVHDPGAASQEDGFHTFLAAFIGWSLPLVPRFDGSESLLYLEAVFPMLFVEQKRGWSAIQGPFPTFLRIQDISRRVMEYLLNLQAATIRRERADARRLLANIQQRWSDRKSSLIKELAPTARLKGLPDSPTAEFANNPDVSIEVYRTGVWQPIGSVVTEASERFQILSAAEPPTASTAAQETEERLSAVRARVDELMAGIESLRGDYFTSYQENRAVEARIAALEFDLRRNKDALKLKRLGSQLGRAAGEQICPTCHQSITSELLPTVSTVGMGLEDNVTFVESQLQLYRTMLRTSTEQMEERREHYQAAEAELRERQREVRSLRQALLQPSAAPSRAVIEESVNLQAYLDRISSIQENVDGLVDELRSIAQDWTNLQDRIKRLAKDDLTETDNKKVRELQTQIQTLLAQYGFKSFQPTEIRLSQDNFRPLVLTRENDQMVEKEINFEISASDAIRLKWAYYMSLLAVAKSNDTNHCGLLIFDEPGQQEMETASLISFLRLGASDLASNQQVLVATSEGLETLKLALTGYNARIVAFDGFILKPVAENS